MAQKQAEPDATPRDNVTSPGGGKSLSRALAYLSSYRRETLGAFSSLLLVSVANLLAPQLIRQAVDVGIARKQMRAVVFAVGGLLTIALLRGLFNFSQVYLAERASQGVAFDLRDALFERIQRLSFSYYDRVQTGQLLTRLTNDVEQIRTFVGSGMVQIGAALIMLLGSMVLLLVINWRLALVTLTTIPFIFILLLRFVRRIGPLFIQVQQTLGGLNSILKESLAGMRVIRAFRREDFENKRYSEINEDLLDKNVRAVRAISNGFPLVVFFANLGTLAVFWYGGFEIIGGRLTVGELLAFNSYLSLLLLPILTLGFLAAGIARAGVSAGRVFEILDAPLEVEDLPDARRLSSITGRVEFRDVHFRYPGGDREVLRGVSFTAEPGQTVAILGTTGSGKSTMVNLLPRFYDVTEGGVLIDGSDVREVTLASLRSQIGIVLQETLLFSGSVRDNIAYGKPDATHQEIIDVARAAQADDFIRALPEGYETLIGEKGIGLSGGQRQRIAIARALLIDPRLLILDDSTAAVDAETEAAIKEALDRLMHDSRRTALVIAQRISTVQDADLILVLDEGRIAVKGTHAELINESELYLNILDSQLLKEPEQTPPGSAGNQGTEELLEGARTS